MTFASLFLFATLAASSAPEACVTFRFDDAHPASEWRALAEVFEARGFPATFAVNAGMLKTDDQRSFLVAASAKGHEIVDHLHDHAIFSYRCRDSAEFEALASAPVVAETVPAERRLNLRYAFKLEHPANFRFRGAVSNGFLLVSRETAASLRRPDKVFVPALNRAFGFFDSPDGRIRLRTFWTTSEATLPDQPEGEFVSVSRRAFKIPDDVLRFQAKRSRAAFAQIGLPAPTAWAQPGGWEPWLDDTDFKRVYADEFGYRLGDAFVPHGAKPDVTLAPFHVRYSSFFDNATMTQAKLRAQIGAARAEGRPVALISHMKPPRGMAWEVWLTETARLLDWLRAEKIPVVTASELGSRLARSVRISANRKRWDGLLEPPDEYACVSRSVCKAGTFACAGFDVEVYFQANGPESTQRVMMAVPHGLKGKAPCVVAPFYFPEAMLGFNPADGSADCDLAPSGTNLTYYAAVAYMGDLVRRGYVVISADAYHLTYRNHEEPWWSCDWSCLEFLWSNPWQRVGEALNEDCPDWSGVGKLVFDTRLLVDLAAADPRVDAGRIGMIGHSLGGKMAFCAGMTDARVKVVVASDFGLGWTQTNWGDCWYWGEKLAEMRAEGLSNVDLLSASGGKPFCLIAGKYDDADSGRLMFSAQGYEQSPERLLFIHHGSGHRPPRVATERGYAFLDRYLKDQKRAN